LFYLNYITQCGIFSLGGFHDEPEGVPRRKKVSRHGRPDPRVRQV